MNNRERAEKMVQTMLFAGLGDNKSYYEYFLAQIDEAVKEYATQVKEPIRCAYDQGYAAAREQAAGIANSFEPDQCTRAYAEGYNDAIDDASRAIRAMVPPGEGK